MAENLNTTPTAPARIVIVGAGGFVGSAIATAAKKRGYEVLSLGRTDVDLMADGSGEKLQARLQTGDTVVFVSAKAPCKDYVMFEQNIALAKNALDGLVGRPLAQVLYISSDAVYSDSPDPLTETSVTAPDNLHGQMHVARETMFAASLGDVPLGVLRPTLIYGADDPHNGYGPNRFRRLADDGEPIVLFGEGEERRDHVYIEDVGELVTLSLLHRSQGVINVATGQVASFHDIAEKVLALHRPDGTIETTPRHGPMPHGGFRSFVIAECQKAFPTFRYTDLDTGLARVHQQTTETS